MERLDATAYLAAPGFEEQLLAELHHVVERRGRWFLAKGPRQAVHWVQNVWLEPLRIPVRSIRDAATKLRAIQRNWALHSVGWHRRASLIAESLPHVSAKPLDFPSPAPTAALGSWCLTGEREVVASPRCTSPFPNGEPRFLEPPEGPPNRTHLKLWEALTLLGHHPASGERCLDAGASPGGWTWALSRLGARVLSVDRAPLAPEVARLPRVECRRGNAFAIRPETEGPFDWIVCDVVAYPEKLWEWISLWLRSGSARNIVCTVKFQGRDHYGAMSAFESVPGSRLVHLSVNKHELTWMWPLTPSKPEPTPGR